MNWIFQVHQTNPTAQAIAIISLVCVAGMGLGSVRVRGIKLGASGVLFAGILVGHFSNPIDSRTLEFVREFGLILFVFCMGLQLGPGFFSSLRQTGLRLNLLAGLIVVLGAASAAGLGWLLNFDGAIVLGLFSGATTNTPSLGAAQQTLMSFPGIGEDRAALPALACAVTYPGGILGAIAALLMLRAWFQIDVGDEMREYAAAESAGVKPLERRTLVVENPNLEGVAVSSVPGQTELGVVVSRIRRRGQDEVVTAVGQSILQVGDSLLAVGTTDGLNQFERVVGRASHENLLNAVSSSTQCRIVLTNSEAVGRKVRELNLESLYGVLVTSVMRGDVEMIAVPALRLRFGDVLQTVGGEDGIRQAAARLGNSVQALNETHFVPLFAGIVAGIVLGTFPIACPGLPQPLRLGLAGGPLIVAILVGRLGRIGRLVWHMPRNANLAFRELGIALFFAGVGLLAGPTFFAAACSFAGMLWLFAGIGVTIVPLLLAGVFARTMLAMNFVTFSGLVAGSMTSPPVLTFATAQCETEAPAVAYASVYPLTMLLRIMAAQVLAVILCG